jgi:carbamoylphosphate synthase large subunit
MAKIMVTGVGGPAGRNVAALLLERHHQVVGTDSRLLPAQTYPVHQVPPADAPDFLSALYSLAARERPDLIIPTVSEELPVLACASHLRAVFPVLVSSGQAIETANDKYLTAQALTKARAAVPRFVLPSHVSNPQVVAEHIGWPCISKPRVSRGGREVHWHTELEWSFIAALSDGYILQEFAEGIDYAPNVFIDPLGKATVVTLEKTELKEGRVGNATKVRRVEAPDVADLAVAAARAVGLIGPLDIDIRRRADGRPVVLEINARFGANIRFAPEILDATLATFMGSR